MEKFGLVDKTKDELIDSVLELEAKEKQKESELDEVRVKLTKTEGFLKTCKATTIRMCVMNLILVIAATLLVFFR